MSREAMQLALEALEKVITAFGSGLTLQQNAITALRQALVDADDTSQKRVDEMVKTEHDRAVELGKAYERGWNAALAQREWVGLKDEEIVAATNAVHGFGAIKQKDMNFAKAIEQALKEKNT